MKARTERVLGAFTYVVLWVCIIAVLLVATARLSAQTAIPEKSLVELDGTVWVLSKAAQLDQEIVTQQDFGDHVDVTKPTLFLGCVFRAGVTFRDTSHPSQVFRCRLGNTLEGESNALVRCEPKARARIEQCRFMGSAGAGVLLSGGLEIYRCTFTEGTYAHNVLSCKGWGGGLVEKSLFLEKGVPINGALVTARGFAYGNAILNACHAHRGDDPGKTHIQFCTVIGRHALIYGSSGEQMVLRGNDIMSPEPEGTYAVQGWRTEGDPTSTTLPFIAEGNRVLGPVRLEIFPGASQLSYAEEPQAPLKQPGEDLDGLLTSPFYGVGAGWTSMLDAKWEALQ